MKTDRYGVWCTPTPANKKGEAGWLPHNHENGKVGWPLKAARAKADHHNANPLMSPHWTYEVRRLTAAAKALPEVRFVAVHTKHCTTCGSRGHNAITCVEDARLPLPFKKGLRAELRPRRKRAKSVTRGADAKT